MSYKHITTFERSRIEVLHKQGHSAREIAKIINRHHGTISRELKRNSSSYYCAEEAHEKYTFRRNNSSPKGKYSDELATTIQDALKNTWSPEQIAYTLTKGKVCFATFAERKTRMYLAIKIKDRTSESMEYAIRMLARMVPKGTFKTATVDRGKEFACYPIIESDLGIPVYFADSYSSWQRGTNENANVLLPSLKKLELNEYLIIKPHILFIFTSRFKLTIYIFRIFSLFIIFIMIKNSILSYFINIHLLI
ncbi:IS30 family transposase [Clostridium sp.]|uniref:IS30 family transposase n=1 Tax=Clostridium sp. TaxID=1506 RepID=UPI0032173FA9